MTDGTSQGLFIVVAIVIFGIFVVLAYILFEDTLSPALASMFGESTEQASERLKDKYSENILIFREDNLKDNNNVYNISKKEVVKRQTPILKATVTQITENNMVDFPGLSLFFHFSDENLSVDAWEGKDIKISFYYKTSSPNKNIRITTAWKVPEGFAYVGESKKVSTSGWHKYEAKINDFNYFNSDDKKARGHLLIFGDLNVGESLEIKDVEVRYK